MIDKTVWFYKELDLPELPDHLSKEFDRLIDLYLLDKPQTIYDKQHTNEDGYVNYLMTGATLLKENFVVPGVESIYHEMTAEFMDWFRTNISPEAKRPRFSVFNPPPEKRMGYLPTHCDMIRNYALNYVFMSGGGNVATAWFQEEGQPVIRGTQAELGRSVAEQIQKPLNHLVSVRIPLNRWHLIRTDILHRVEYITSPRIRITADPGQQEVNRLNQFVVKTID